MIMLTNEQIKRLHKKLLYATGGLDGLRDETMLDSALSVAFQTRTLSSTSDWSWQAEK